MKPASQFIAVVARPTRLQELASKRSTVAAARFVIENNARLRSVQKKSSKASKAEAAASFTEYEEEDHRLNQALAHVKKSLDLGLKVVSLERDHIANFDFGRACLIVVVGPDGLVANTAKYAGQVPIMGVNPDPSRISGVLLPFSPHDVEQAARLFLQDKSILETVTLAEATTNDGQKMLAFNDFFIGRRSHASARYTLNDGTHAEAQCSSGIIVSTGAGFTGWFSSLVAMVERFPRGFKKELSFVDKEPLESSYPRLCRSDRKLFWAVREPYISRNTQANHVSGILDEKDSLTLESLMPEGGVIFSDGIENDFIEFNSGTSVEIKVSQKSALLLGK